MALDDAQFAVFNADLDANTDPVIVQAKVDGTDQVIQDWYNDPDLAYIVWRNLVPPNEVGLGFNGTEFGNLTTANTSRITSWFTSIIGSDSSAGGFIGFRQDHRDFFDDVFSVGGLTIANLAVIWRRSANEVEKLFTTGTGTDLDPATLDYEGGVSLQEVAKALA